MCGFASHFGSKKAFLVDYKRLTLYSCLMIKQRIFRSRRLTGLIPILHLVLTSTFALAGDEISDVEGLIDEIIVTNFSDLDDGLCDADCSLREALNKSNNLVGASGSIVFDNSVFSVPRIINLAEALPDITNSLNLAGPGADLLTVRRDSENSFGIFNVPGPGLSIEMSDLTISNGNSQFGVGGGIYSESHLVLNSVVVSDSRADDGAAIYLSADGEFRYCSFHTNESNRGGGIFYRGGEGNVLRIENSSISDNMARQGGAIYFQNFDVADHVEMTISSSTLVANTTIWTLVMETEGEGRTSQVTLDNSIIAGGSEANLVSLSGSGGTPTFISIGYNLTDDNSSLLLNATGDQVEMDPMLGPLGNYGYPIPGHPPLPGSPVIDGGSCAVSGLSVDQRHVARPFDAPDVANVADGCDIGAIEWTDDVFEDGFEPNGTLAVSSL
jgi:CSLREA domain-containing protein